MLRVMDLISDRIWIPHQIALEYHKHMLDEIHNQNNTYRDIIDYVRDNIDDLKKWLSNLRNSNINLEEIIAILDESQNKIVTNLEAQEKDQPDLIQIMNQITSLLENKIGDAYSQIELDNLFKDGLRRFENKIPPGYKDVKEKENRKTVNNGLIYEDKFGDLIFWRQILDISKKESTKSVILVTDDNKEDWILKIKGQKKGPHPELIHEFKKESNGKLFYLYNTEQFLKYATEFLRLNDGSLDVDEAIKNVTSTKELLHNLQGPTGVQYVEVMESDKFNRIKGDGEYKYFYQYNITLYCIVVNKWENILHEFINDLENMFNLYLKIYSTSVKGNEIIKLEVMTNKPFNSLIIDLLNNVNKERYIVTEINGYLED